MAQPRPRRRSSDSYSSATRTSDEWPFDYFHINSIDQRADGTHADLRAQHLGDVRLNTRTGQVLGARSAASTRNVKLGAGARTAYQHDATTLPNGTISVFDNGARAEGPPAVARAGAVARRAGDDRHACVAQYEHTPALSSGSQGNIQQLENGDVFVGWGVGAILLGVQRQRRSCCSTRTCTAPTSPIAATASPGPARPPSAAVDRRDAASGSGARRVYASWNGDTRTASWRVLAGASASTLAPVATRRAQRLRDGDRRRPAPAAVRGRAGARRVAARCSAPRARSAADAGRQDGEQRAVGTLWTVRVKEGFSTVGHREMTARKVNSKPRSTDASPPSSGGARYRRLPTGAHGLTREEVERDQRERLRSAMVELIAQRGYPAVRILDLTQLAHVSRPTFYNLYADKEELLLSAYEDIAERTTREGRRGIRNRASSDEHSLRRALEAFAELGAAEPEAMTLALLGTFGAGPRALERRDAHAARAGTDRRRRTRERGRRPAAARPDGEVPDRRHPRGRPRRACAKVARTELVAAGRRTGRAGPTPTRWNSRSGWTAPPRVRRAGRVRRRRRAVVAAQPSRRRAPAERPPRPAARSGDQEPARTDRRRDRGDRRREGLRRPDDPGDRFARERLARDLL